MSNLVAPRKVAEKSRLMSLVARSALSWLCALLAFALVCAAVSRFFPQRVKGVALKEERKLVLCPRETPLSTIHLENMLRVRQAGATVLFLAPGFYHGAETVGDLVDFIVARCLDQLGLEHTVAPRWGE